MDTLIIASCEDEQEDRSHLAAALEATGIPYECSWFQNGADFLASFAPSMYDLVFLDVYLGDTNGVDIAASIREVDPSVPIAFVTSSVDHALDGYRYRIDRYIVKPCREPDVREAMELAMQRAKSQQGRSLQAKGADPIPYRQISFIEQKNHAIIVHLADGGEVRLSGKIDAFEQELPSPPFFRSHKSFLVNLDHVKRIDRDLNVFEMDDGENAYIRRASVREAGRAFENRLISRTTQLGEF